ncbi:hypothetical protein FB451DRAFT_1061927 [Mycena latifolia]|nr:hypothetical protein FB451DRAFT_1061927 [Mycena latifolia]
MPISWRNRFFLLLVPCALGIFFFLSLQTHFGTSGALLNQGLTAISDPSPAVDERPPPKILLVTAFFPLSKSKHTMSDYESWLSKFLRAITTDIYFYAPVEMEALIRRCRGDLPITVNTTFASPFDVPPLNGTRERYYAMHAQDRERKIHSAELYAVWNAKPYFLDAAVQALAAAGRDYDYAFWNDAGSFRTTHAYAGWPDPARVRAIWDEGSALTGEKPEDLLFFPVARMPNPSMQFWMQDFGPVDNEISEGSFFGGAPSTVAWWRRTFYAYHDYYLARDIFVGKDQTLINALFFLFPARVIAVWLDDPEAPAHAGLPAPRALGNCGAEWFYYQFWLGAPAERHAMREVWSSGAWLPWNWSRTREPCRVTRVVAMKDLLQRQFGSGWQPPMHTIDV